MKTSLPAMMLATTLACTAPLVSAGEGCLKNNQRNTALGQAIGVLVYDSIVKDYSEFAKVEDIAAGLKHASEGTKFLLHSKTTIESDPDSEKLSNGSLSKAEAQKIVKNWRSQSDQLGLRFMAEYKQRGTLQKSELLTYRLPLQDVQFSDAGQDQLTKCISRFSLPAEDNLKQVCYLQLQINEESTCNPDAEVLNTLTSSATLWTYGEFNPDEVIEGWVEAFKLLDEEPLKVLNKDPETAGTQSETRYLELLEVVIPTQLAYGSKGMSGKVGSDETLWFVMAVK